MQCNQYLVASYGELRTTHGLILFYLIQLAYIMRHHVLRTSNWLDRYLPHSIYPFVKWSTVISFAMLIQAFSLFTLWIHYLLRFIIIWGVISWLEDKGWRGEDGKDQACVAFLHLRFLKVFSFVFFSLSPSSSPSSIFIIDSRVSSQADSNHNILLIVRMINTT